MFSYAETPHEYRFKDTIQMLHYMGSYISCANLHFFLLYQGSQDSANMARLTVVNQRRGVGRGKKIPPEVPRRSSSIKSSESSGSVDRSVSR